MRTGWYGEVRVKSVDSHLLQGVLGTHAQLVSLRIHITTQIRGLLENVGVFVVVGRRQTFDAAVEEATRDRPAGAVRQTLRVSALDAGGAKPHSVRGMPDR